MNNLCFLCNKEITREDWELGPSLSTNPADRNPSVKNVMMGLKGLCHISCWYEQRAERVRRGRRESSV